MSAWVVRAGARGESEAWNLANGKASVGWGEVGDLSHCDTRDDVSRMVAEVYANDSSHKRGAHTGQLWAFSKTIAPGDLVVMPMKTEPGMIAIGRCRGPYEFDGSQPEEHRHMMSVEWRPDLVARASLKDDLLASINAIRTVFSPTRNMAEARLARVYDSGSDPGRTDVSYDGKLLLETDDGEVVDPQSAPSLRAIRDRVTTHVIENFGQHKLTYLVAEILESMGFSCAVSPPGPDGGVDILAGSGPLGLDSPTLVVEVKSEPTQVGSLVVRGLDSAINRHGADQGLLVALGGVTRQARQEFSTQRTRIRIWDADYLLDHLFERYEQLPVGTRQRLPLTRAWVLDEPEE